MNEQDKKRLMAHVCSACDAVGTLRAEVDAWPILDGTDASYVSVCHALKLLAKAQIAVGKALRKES